MPTFRQKTSNCTTLADEVAALHGLTKSTVRPLAKSFFAAMVKQFFETGKLKIPGFANFTLEITIKSGKPKAFVRFVPVKSFRAQREAVVENPESLDFLNYILERDGKKYMKIEDRRLKGLAFARKMRELRKGHEQARIAAAILASTGQVVDPTTIADEHSIPPLGHTRPLPEHRTSVHEIVAKTGVFPPEKVYRHPDPRDGSPSDQPPVDNSSS